jgi:hypothetical protein
MYLPCPIFHRSRWVGLAELGSVAVEVEIVLTEQAEQLDLDLVVVGLSLDLVVFWLDLVAFELGSFLACLQTDDPTERLYL